MSLRVSPIPNIIYALGLIDKKYAMNADNGLQAGRGRIREQIADIAFVAVQAQDLVAVVLQYRLGKGRFPHLPRPEQKNGLAFEKPAGELALEISFDYI